MVRTPVCLSLVPWYPLHLPPLGTEAGHAQPSTVLVKVARIPKSSFQMGKQKSLEGRNLPRVLHPIGGTPSLHWEA